ncbi:MAG: hypothetical protein JXB03_01935 [Spirochaetales bacterium]|nr:hypothetical protein [Spirochaetales bacterium]
MIYCYRCGVELETNATFCPLCQTPVPSEALGPEEFPDHDGRWATGYPSLTQGLAVSTSEGMKSKKYAAQFLSIVLLLPLLPMLLIWFVQEPGMPWILWLGGFLFGFWILTVPLRRLSAYPVPYSAVILVVFAGILIVIDWTYPPIDWSIKVALPISSLFVIGYVFLRWISRRFTDFGIPFIAGVILSFAIITSVSDGLINLHFGEQFWGAWSISLVLGFPASIALWFLHYRMGWRIDGKRFFDL